MDPRSGESKSGASEREPQPHVNAHGDGSAAPFRVREWVRWSDVDAAGIVCYGMYLRFFEIAESDLFRDVHLPVRTLTDEHGLWLVRRRITCDFVSPAKVDDELEVSVYVHEIGRTSLELRFVVVRTADRVITAEASYVLVAVDRDRLQPVPLPEAVRSALAPYLSERAPVLAALGLPPAD